MDIASTGVMEGGIEMQADMKGLIQYGSHFPNQPVFDPNHLQKQSQSKYHPFSVSLSAEAKLEIQLKAMLRLMIQVGEASTEPLVQIKLVAYPFLSLRATLQYPAFPPLAPTTTPPNFNAAPYTWPQNGCHFPHYVRYSVEVGVAYTFEAGYSLSLVGFPDVQKKYEKTFEYPSRSLLAGCLGNASSYLPEDMRVPRVSLQAMLQKLPLAKQSDPPSLKSMLWDMVRAKLQREVAKATNVPVEIIQVVTESNLIPTLRSSTPTQLFIRVLPYLLNATLSGSRPTPLAIAQQILQQITTPTSPLYTSTDPFAFAQTFDASSAQLLTRPDPAPADAPSSSSAGILWGLSLTAMIGVGVALLLVVAVVVGLLVRCYYRRPPGLHDASHSLPLQPLNEPLEVNVEAYTRIQPPTDQV
eukprot:TRINITY_DN14770_c0_g1_i3.p1 TRINITY_DN14770_c0_g1~~TRINITY_DN14770_c0_g1_i3.p1  ORF type:complete len:483 (-),score=105.49 TRINITY_DN14770_c0_g1_i3:62-1300(-)